MLQNLLSHPAMFLINKTGSVIRFTMNVTITLQYSLSTKQDQITFIVNFTITLQYSLSTKQDQITFIVNFTITLQYSLSTKQDQLSDLLACHHHTTIFLNNKTGSIIKFTANVTIKHQKYIFGEIVT